MLLATGLAILQRAAAFIPEAPLGTGLEWMTIAAIVLPALVLILLVYAGQENTV
jgi:hypothetical protein